MQVTAALAPEKGAPFRLETLALADPGPDELVVRVAACGVCQTDAHGRDDYFGIPFPCVFGHEGAGVVERLGKDVTGFAAGERVLMVSPSCGACKACALGLPGYCASARRIKFGGRLRDGRVPFHRNGEPVHGAFFQQSAFASHALATQRNIVKVPDELPLEQAAAFACGLNTGVGAVLNVLRPAPGSAIAVFGAGTVGLAAVMAARIADCGVILAVDLHESRLALAGGLGATHVCNAATADPVAAIRAATGGAGAEASIEAAGNPLALRQAMDCLAPLGVCVLVGSARKGVEACLEMAQLQHGRTLRGCIQGDAPPADFFPRLFELWRTGRLPVERLIRFYDFADINLAMADAAAGHAVKPVLRMEQA
ncbi:MAG TPA: NAD(P)-dependent alcohol dehydrogenase [Burkholderiales bacterium]|nr:NAD(P)-dependent alcohol dehydrogenase [Burkholderiales bacterium]